jgi:hypothetical protein
MSFIITCMPVIRKIVAIKSATKIALLAIYIYIYIYMVLNDTFCLIKSFFVDLANKVY